MSVVGERNFVSRFWFLVFGFWLSRLALNVFRIFILSFVISAIGVSLIILKASLFDVCIFRTFVPGIARQVSSFVFSCPISATSATSEVAYLAAQIRLSAASVEARSIERWEYVRAIGLFKSFKKNESAAEV